jgi:DNA-binding NarL/FixJ family response regulator
MEKKYSVLIVEDHTLLRQGLIAMISSDPSLVVVGEADNGRDAIRQATTLKPDVVLMDINMPVMNGSEALAEIKNRDPNVKVIMLTAHNAEEYIRDSIKAGANGYVLKQATRDELILGIHKVIGGKTYLTPDVADKLFNKYLSGSANNETSAWEQISKREREVLKLVAEGNTNKLIANHMCVSIKTVEKHRSNLMKKLDLHNSAALTAFAIEKGIITTR